MREVILYFPAGMRRAPLLVAFMAFLIAAVSSVIPSPTAPKSAALVTTGILLGMAFSPEWYPANAKLGSLDVGECSSPLSPQRVEFWLLIEIAAKLVIINTSIIGGVRESRRDLRFFTVIYKL